METIAATAIAALSFAFSICTFFMVRPSVCLVCFASLGTLLAKAAQSASSICNVLHVGDERSLRRFPAVRDVICQGIAAYFRSNVTAVDIEPCEMAFAARYAHPGS